MFIANAEQAKATLSAAVEATHRMHPHLSFAAPYEYHLAWIVEELGDPAAARRMFDTIELTDEDEGTLVKCYRALLAGDAERALSDASALASKLAKDSAFYSRWRSVDANLVAALAAERMNDRAQLVGHAEAALAAIDTLGEFASNAYVQRRRGRVLAMLALHGSRDAAPRKEAALAWARRAGGYDARIAALTAE
jgi:hypothetical protein